MLSFRSLATTLVFAISLIGATTTAQGKPPSLDGVYTLGANASDDMNKIIEAVLADMSFMTRSFARGIFKKRHPAYSRIEIAHDAKEVVVTFDNGNPMRMPIDGATAQWEREDGVMLTIQCEWRNTGLTQTISTNDWQRVNDFVLDAAGTMTLKVDFFQKPPMEKPMLYRLIYRRAAAR